MEPGCFIKSLPVQVYVQHEHVRFAYTPRPGGDHMYAVEHL